MTWFGVVLVGVYVLLIIANAIQVGITLENNEFPWLSLGSMVLCLLILAGVVFVGTGTGL